MFVYLLAGCRNAVGLPDVEFGKLSLTDSTTSERLIDPVKVRGDVAQLTYNRASIVSQLPIQRERAAVASAGTPLVGCCRSDVFPDLPVSLLLVSYPKNVLNVTTVQFTPASQNIDPIVRLDMKPIWKDLMRASNDQPCLRMIAPLSLNRAPKPSLTRDKTGKLVVYTGRGKDVDVSTTIYCPLTNSEDSVNPQRLAQDLEKLGSTAGEAGAEVEFADDREPREGILVVLDTSSSMSNPAGFTDAKADEDEDEREERESWPENELPQDTEMTQVQRQEFEIAKAKFLQHRSLPDLKAIANERTFWITPTRRALDVIHELIRMEKNDIKHNKALSRYRNKFAAILLETESAASNASALAAEIKNSSENPDETPANFQCPITQSLLTDPVVASDGFTYERTAISEWFQTHDTSPMIGAKLASKDLVSNHNLRSQINEYIEEKL